MAGPSKRERCRGALRALPDDAVPGYLVGHSGLPGPRADLELLAAFGDVASPGLILAMADEPDEYLRSRCSTEARAEVLALRQAQGA